MVWIYELFQLGREEFRDHAMVRSGSVFNTKFQPLKLVFGALQGLLQLAVALASMFSFGARVDLGIFWHGEEVLSLEESVLSLGQLQTEPVDLLSLRGKFLLSGRPNPLRLFPSLR